MYNTTLESIWLGIFRDKGLGEMTSVTQKNINAYLKIHKDCGFLDTYPQGYLRGAKFDANLKRVRDLSKKLSDSKRMKPKTYLGAPVLNRFGKQKMEVTYTQPLEVRHQWETERTNLRERHNLTVLFDLLKDACVRYGQQGVMQEKPIHLHLKEISHKYNDDGCGMSQSCVSRWQGVSHEDRVRRVVDEFYGSSTQKTAKETTPKETAKETTPKKKWSTSKKVFVFGGVALIGVGGFFVSKKYFN